MSNTNTGGPAFPLVYDIPPENVRTVYQGMTLRDYFAAKALPVINMSTYSSVMTETRGQYIARHAYAIADAMLKARDR